MLFEATGTSVGSGLCRNLWLQFSRKAHFGECVRSSFSCYDSQRELQASFEAHAKILAILQIAERCYGSAVKRLSKELESATALALLDLASIPCLTLSWIFQSTDCTKHD